MPRTNVQWCSESMKGWSEQTNESLPPRRHREVPFRLREAEEKITPLPVYPVSLTPTTPPSFSHSLSLTLSLSLRSGKAAFLTGLFHVCISLMSAHAHTLAHRHVWMGFFALRGNGEMQGPGILFIKILNMWFDVLKDFWSQFLGISLARSVIISFGCLCVCCLPEKCSRLQHLQLRFEQHVCEIYCDDDSVAVR